MCGLYISLNDLSISLKPESHRPIHPRLDALSSAYSFTHTPRPTGRGGGTGLLTTPKLSFLFSLPHFTPLSLAVTVTHPVQLTIFVLYRPPGPLGDFLEELP